MNGPWHLLTRRRFLPLLITQIGGGLVDNLAKSAFLALLTFGSIAGGAADPKSLAALAGACLIIPFALFSGTAGQLADRYDRRTLLIILKSVELLTMLLTAATLLTGSIPLCLVALFAVGTQATFGSPVKFALMPQHLAPDELIDGNALMEGFTYLAILGGTLAGGIATAFTAGTEAACGLLVLLGGLGLTAAFFVPAAPAPAPDLTVIWNPIPSTRDILRAARDDRKVWESILAASWFWLIGSVLLTQFPALAKEIMRGDEAVLTLFLVLFSVGVGAGSLLCGRLMHGRIDGRYVPIAAFVMAVACLDLGTVTDGFTAGAALEPLDLFRRTDGLRLLIDLTLVATAGGVYVVPLYAIIQSRTHKREQARAIAANNVLNAVFMVAGAGGTALAFALGADLGDLFTALGVGCLGAAFYGLRLLPVPFVPALVKLWFTYCYRVKIVGLDRYPANAPSVLIIANHVSFMDGALLAAFLPARLTFTINSFVAVKWWARPFLEAVELFPIDPSKPMSMKSFIKALRHEDGVERGGRVHGVIFPEGRLNSTGGALMKIYAGSGLVADKTGVPIVPVRIEGTELTPLGRLAAWGILPKRWFPAITITILPPVKLDLPDGVKGRQRRRIATDQLYDIMSGMMAARAQRPTVFAAFLEARARYGAKSLILEDQNRQPISYDRVLQGTMGLGRKLEAMSKPGEIVGVLLPNAIGNAVTFLALHAFGRVPALLNVTAGAEGIALACRTAGVKTVLTSDAFIKAARLGPVIRRLEQDCAIVRLEEVRASIGFFDKIAALRDARRAERLHRNFGLKTDDPAVIVFTSGSEGSPRGVALSHANLLANRRQVSARLDFSPRDVVLNALPMFHAFGLTGGFLLPLLSGVRCILYPSPLHYRIIPEIAYDAGATIIFGTDTFLAGYARSADPYDFYAVRYIVAGAERVQDTTRQTYMEKFGLRILEGYGATECAPVIAVNTPMHYRAGTVGRILSEITYRIDPVPGIDADGRLFVRGPNIMLGYLNRENPGVIEPLADGWHDTGDVVNLSRDGFLSIEGRVRRFAKIAGEMISLAVSERVAALAAPTFNHAVIAVRDAKKGERLILITTAPDLDPATLAQAARTAALPDLATPREVHWIQAIPVLGSGKTDYPAVRRFFDLKAEPHDTLNA